jgi:signal transduction histidine kinase
MSNKTAMPGPGVNLAELWDVIPAGLVVVDETLKIVAYNKAWSGLCDTYLNKKPAAGMDITVLIPDEVPARMLADALHGRTSRQNGHCFDDGDRYFDLTAVPAAGGALLMAIDSTDRCNTLKGIEAARSEAEFYVDLMSHDIRNFNQVTMGYIELLQLAEKLTPSELAYLEKAQKGVWGSNKLIDNIKKIRMIRQFAGKSLVKTDLNAILKQDAAEVKKASPKAKITLDVKEKGFVMADEYVHDIFRHILENAVKYDPHPEKLIDVTVQPALIDGRDFWSVHIADHGTGVPEDKKKSIFERMTRTTKGAGVGLSIVGVIVNKYGGRIRVEDRVKGDPSKGSVFIVDLPQA